MDLNTAEAIVRVGEGPDGLLWPDGDGWRPGDRWLAGGSWLFSEPQPGLRRLVDLSALAWPSITISPEGLELAATCTLAELFALASDADRVPADWDAARLIAPCCGALRGSFKVWNVATVGGNLCLALPAGPMISLTAALDGVCTTRGAGGSTRRIAALDFVLDVGRCALEDGELLRSILIPAARLRCRPALRWISLHGQGRPAALLIGLLDPADGAFALTISASTRRPVRLSFPALPAAGELAAAVGEQDWVDDVHGSPAWRAHLTRTFAEEIRAELACS